LQKDSKIYFKETTVATKKLTRFAQEILLPLQDHMLVRIRLKVVQKILSVVH